MHNLLSKIKDRIIRKLFRDPYGYGRPIGKEFLENEYITGHWDHFFAFDELPRNLVIAGAVNHFFERPSVLDIGCGSGRLAKVFQNYPFSRYIGVDLSTEAVARARALNLPAVSFIEGDFEAWRPDTSFDAIVFNECIGYARDPAATLAAFSPHLAEGGCFFPFPLSLRKLQGAVAQNGPSLLCGRRHIRHEPKGADLGHQSPPPWTFPSGLICARRDRRY